MLLLSGPTVTASEAKRSSPSTIVCRAEKLAQAGPLDGFASLAMTAAVNHGVA